MQLFYSVFRRFYFLLQIYNFVSPKKNYSYKTNYIKNYRVNYVNINTKATNSDFVASFTITEKNK